MIDEWIYTETRKPESMTEVLLCVIIRSVGSCVGDSLIRTVGYYRADYDVFIAESGNVLPPDDVVCWRSIPDIPLCVMERYR